MTTAMRAPDKRWDWICVLGIWLLNGAIIRELFSVHYSRHMGSIEAAYIGLSRIIAADFGDVSWFPYWYNGIPFQNAYPPLLHFLTALYMVLAQAPAALAHHTVTAFFYCLGPVTVFAWARRLGMSQAGSLVAGLAFSLVSFSALLITPVRVDVGGIGNARRLQALVQYGEGPHVSSITLLPLALLALDYALQKRRPFPYLLSAGALASVVLTNWLGGFSLAVGVVAYLVAQKPEERISAMGRTLIVGCAAYALAAPWIPPSTVNAVRVNSQWMHGDYPIGWANVVVGALVLGVTVWVVEMLRRRAVAAPARFGVAFFLLIGSIVLAAEWLHFYLVPQPQRYHLQMELALSLLVGTLFAAVFPRRRLFAAALILLLAAISVLQVRNYRRYAQSLFGPVAIEKTIEYRAARWLEQHLPGRRVMMAGTVGFWLNVFSDSPQLAGGFDQGIINPFLPAVLFQILSGMNAGDREAAVATLWLQAYGVHAVGVSGPASSEVYKPFANPEKFAGYLQEIWREDDFRIYAVPQRWPALAKVVPRAAIVARPPRDVFDLQATQEFVAAMNDERAPPAAFSWENRHTAVIRARIPADAVVVAHISYHPGWEASVRGRSNSAGQGRPAAIFADGLHQLVIDPSCAGECTITLRYTGGGEMRMARLLSAFVLLAALAWAVTSWWKTRPTA